MGLGTTRDRPCTFQLVEFSRHQSLSPLKAAIEKPPHWKSFLPPSLRITTIIGVKFEPAPSRFQQPIQSLVTTMSPPMRGISFSSITYWRGFLDFIRQHCFLSKGGMYDWLNRRRYNIQTLAEPFEPFIWGLASKDTRGYHWRAFAFQS